MYMKKEILIGKFLLKKMSFLRIKSVSWEYSCDEDSLEEFDKENILEYTFLLDALQQNRLDPYPLLTSPLFYFLLPFPVCSVYLEYASLKLTP